MDRISPKVSVIIGTYNRCSILPVAIESVLAQTYTDFELLIIDNGSIDQTEKVVRSYSDSRIRYVLNPKPTQSCAGPRNIGLEMSKGKFIAFLDDDDIWYPNKLKVCLDLLSGTDDEVLICHAQNIICYGKMTRKNICGPWADNMHEKLLYERNFLGPGSVVIRKSALASVSGFCLREDFLGCED